MSRPDPIAEAVAESVAKGVYRIVAPNPSPMTANGTNTYLVLGAADANNAAPVGAAVIDPGPDIAEHLDAIRAAAEALNARIEAIFVTHTHRDHSPGATALAKAVGAPLYAYGRYGDGMSATMQAFVARGELTELSGGEGADRDFTPHHRLAHGERVEGSAGAWALEAVYTPGHLSDHHSFALEAPAGAPTGLLFSGDVVMGWSTSIVSPPEGDMTAFYAALDTLSARSDSVYAPGHGDLVEDPAGRVAELRAHRQKREASVLAALPGAADAPALLSDITIKAYADTPGAVLSMAERNALAHLIDLVDRGAAEIHLQPGSPSRFRQKATSA